MKLCQNLLCTTLALLTYLLLLCAHTVASIDVSANSPLRGLKAELSCSFSSTEQYLVVKWERSEAGSDVVIALYRFTQRTTQYSGDDDRYTLTVNQGQDLSVATLVISNVALDDIGDYKCELFGSSASSATVRLEVLVPPEEVAIIDSRTNSEIFDGGVLKVTSGQPTLITCLTHFSGTRPATELIWRSQDNIVETYSVSSVVESPGEPRLEQTTSKMNFTTNIDAHGTWLECRANHDGLDEPLRTRITLDVDVPPSRMQLKKSVIEDYMEGEMVTLTEGIPFTVSCFVPATKPEVTIQWTIQDVSLDQSNARETVNVVENPENSLLRDTTSVLVLSNPSREFHRKNLKCNGTGADGISVEKHILLQVNGPPDAPLMVDLPSVIREGEEVRFSCSAHNGFPAPNLRWVIDDRVDVTVNATQGEFHYANGRFTTSSILRFYPTPEYNQRELKCLVAEYENLSSSEILDIKYCPRMFHFTSCPSVRDKDIASVTCEVGPSNPPISLTLSLNGERIDASPTSDVSLTVEEYNGLGYPGMISRLHYTSPPVYRQNGPFTYSCCISDPSGTCPLVPCEECTLDIHYQPIINLIRRSPTSAIRVGMRVVITCQVEANPVPEDLVQWEVQEPGSSQWSHHNTTGVERNGSEWKLVFDEMQISDAKEYRCVADNGIGRRVYSDSVRLAVMYTPIISPSVPTLVRTQEGMEKKLICRAWGNPAPVITWYNATRHRLGTDPGKHSVYSEVEMQNSYNGSLVREELVFFKISRVKHFGYYYCNATNSYGTSIIKILLNGTSIPEAPQNLREIERLTTSTTLSFSWTPGEDGGETQYFDIEFCPVERSSKCIVRQQTLPNYTATNLSPYTKYKITLYSHNAVGYSNGFLSREAITLPLSPAKEGIDITYNSDTGEVFIAENPSRGFNIDDGPCLKLEVRSATSSAWEEQTLPCLMKGVKVTIPKELPLSYIRVKSCIPDTNKCSSVEAIALAVINDEPPTKLIIIIAVIAVFIVLAVVLILFLLCRRKPSHSNIHSGEPFEMKKRTDGYKSFSKDYDNNTGKGEKEAFLPPGYTPSTIYDPNKLPEQRSPSYAAPKQSNGYGIPVDNNPSPTNHSNGLIYAEIGHNTIHPPDQPPIRTESETDYADLDFKKMEEIQEENRKNEENTKNMTAMTQIVPPPGYPEGGLECV